MQNEAKIDTKHGEGSLISNLHDNGFTLYKGINYRARVEASVSQDDSQYDEQQAKRLLLSKKLRRSGQHLLELRAQKPLIRLEHSL